ncbi:hypothetical protein HWV62_20694 [Athelia sp. TMB]|nr:hypothetical protein HWV62_20694 [Athelia sp. TMB]
MNYPKGMHFDQLQRAYTQLLVEHDLLKYTAFSYLQTNSLRPLNFQKTTPPEYGRRRLLEVSSAHLSIHAYMADLKDRIAHDELLAKVAERLSSVSSANTVLPSLAQAPKRFDRNDYPLIRYWTETSWTNRGNTDDNKDLARGVRHLEHSDGRAISTHEGHQFRETARRALNQVSVADPNALPATWSQAGIDLLRGICAELRKEHPIFGLCEANWKAKTFLKEYYSDWSRSKRKSKDSAKEEGTDKDDSTTTVRKRSPASSDVEDTRITKKPRQGETVPQLATRKKGNQRASMPKSTVPANDNL